MRFKRTFFLVFFLVLALGFAYFQLSPRVFRVSMTTQLFFNNDFLLPINKVQIAENLKGLILKGTFNDAIREEFQKSLDDRFLDFQVSVSGQVDTLRIGLDIDQANINLGKEALEKLFGAVSGFYKNAQDPNEKDVRSLTENLGNVLETQKKIISLKEKIDEIIALEGHLSDILIEANIRTTNLLIRQEAYLKDKFSQKEKTASLAQDTVTDLSKDIEYCLAYVKQIEDQLIRLPALKDNLNLKIQKMRFDIDTVHERNMGVGLIAGLKMIEKPRVSLNPVSPSKKKFVAFSVMYGLFFGLVAVFLQEFFLNNFRKK